VSELKKKKSKAKATRVLAEHELASNSPEEPIKRWGWVAAKPSEFLVVYRGGRLNLEMCGQGSRLFKWPSDSVAVIPTTLKEVLFEANQVTSDQVDVRLRGMLVYRITDPLCLHKLINFSSRQRAEAKLARMIGDMCRSTAKWLVANMTLDECNRRRKEEIASALKREVAAVATESWGVEIVTIDIQDVYVQDVELFEAMQATFKAEKEREAELARLASAHQVERQRIANELVAARERQALEMERVQRSGQVELAVLAQHRRRDEEQYGLDNFRVDQEAEIALRKARQEQDRERIAAEGERERASVQVEAQRMLRELEIQLLRDRLAAESSAGPASLERLYVSQALPLVAKALTEGLKDSRISIMNGGGQGDALGTLLNTALFAVQERLAALPQPEA
jgi:flotillin